ncbi:uncharacterized protein LOC131307590 isoform X2 [Rhododendron vialii]|uniref:uncharacterized protein LOC131307590 isoform X2 n=1 Tax=Rhododendron vialii TaxID=182163 RepID=UPI00265F7977|nr:uncharacterized protein LOC131307590 isoform X2 [Rhododendron vialii]
MVVHAPFVQWDIIRHGGNGSTRAGVYYLQTARGERVVCAIAIPGEGNHMTYRPLDSFLEEYHALLPSSRSLEWNFRFQLAAWLDGIMYYSFLQCSEEGVGSCWHLVHASPADVVQRLPQALWQYFLPHGSTKWILVAHGYRVWPVEVVDRQFCDGWDRFRDVHKLKAGYKVIFACERRWIFHTIILDENDVEVRFHWSGAHAHHRRLHPPLDLHTSCLPSAISHEQPVLKFGHLHLPVVQLCSEFELRLKETFCEFGLEEMVIKMSHHAWSVPINDLRLDAGVFAYFLATIDLDFLSYLLVIMLPTLEFRVVVFLMAEDTERIYNWLS